VRACMYVPVCARVCLCVCARVRCVCARIRMLRRCVACVCVLCVPMHACAGAVAQHACTHPNTRTHMHTESMHFPRVGSFGFYVFYRFRFLTNNSRFLKVAFANFTGLTPILTNSSPFLPHRKLRYYVSSMVYKI